MQNRRIIYLKILLILGIFRSFFSFVFLILVWVLGLTSLAPCAQDSDVSFCFQDLMSRLELLTEVFQMEAVDWNDQKFSE